MSELVRPFDAARDHWRGGEGVVILEYGDYECPYSRRAFRVIDRLQAQDASLRFVFRHFPLTKIHAHAWRASGFAEAAAAQGLFWPMHELLFHRQKALEDDDLARYAAELGLDVARFNEDRAGAEVMERVERDVESGLATGEVRGTPTLFIDGSVHLDSYDAATLMEALDQQ
jgi:protein-disulfide isomerase